MIKRTVLFSLLFGALALAQASFLSHFSLFGIVPNVALLSFSLFALFAKTHPFFLAFPAFAGGFVLDMHRAGFIGVWVLIFLGFLFLLHALGQRYLLFPRL